MRRRSQASIAFLVTAGSNAFGQSQFSIYEHANSSKVAPSSWERRLNKQVISGDGGASDLWGFGMKRMLLRFV
jgi:hypothetical protein